MAGATARRADVFYASSSTGRGLRVNRPAMFRSAAAAVLSLLAASALPFDKSGQSFLIEKYLKQNPQALTSRSAATMLADSLGMQYRKSVRADSTRDSAAAVDSLAQKQDKAPPSVYQQLFRYKIVNPDSLIGSLEIFGQNVFRRNTGLAGLNASAASVPAAYPVGPGDEIIVMIWGRINEENRLVVDRNGTVNVPRIGPIQVAGLSFSSVQAALGERLQTIEGVKASVTMGQLRSIPVFVVGEVVSPGQYTLSALANAVTALFEAGGPTPMGSLRTVELRRGGSLVRTIDFYDFLLSGRSDSQLRLQPDDVIFVPIVSSMAAVAGNVRRSAIYEIKPKSKLRELLELAGGITPAGWINRIQIERLKENAYQTVLDVRGESASAIPDIAIEDGDIVKVYPVVNYNERVVFLEGNVKRPGQYALADGMKLSGIITGHDILLPETYFAYSVVQRFDPPSYLARIIPFSLEAVLSAPGGPDDLALQSKDRVIIYNRDYFEPDRSVSIDGAVTIPGKYKLLENLKVRDLILQAGGLREDASPSRGELYRRTSDRETVTTRKIDLCVSCAMADDPQHNLLLEKFDRVYVRRKEGWEDEKTVVLSGEVRFPGTYVVFEGESLEKLIERAGGFTEDAYLSAAIYTRPSVKVFERKRIDEYIQQLQRDVAQATAAMASAGAGGELTQIIEQQTQLIEKLKATIPLGRVVIDMTDSDNYRNFLVEHGDELTVPGNMHTVSVIGEVYNQATYRFVPQQPSVSFYLGKSGGLKPSGDKNGMYLILANGSVVSNRMRKIRSYKMNPGDVLVAPQKISTRMGYKSFMETLDAAVKILTVSSLAVTSIISAKALQD